MSNNIIKNISTLYESVKLKKAEELETICEFTKLDWIQAYMYYLDALWTFTYKKHLVKFNPNVRHTVCDRIRKAIKIFEGRFGYIRHHMLIKANILCGDILLAYFSTPKMILRSEHDYGLHIINITEYHSAKYTVENIIEELKTKKDENKLNLTISMSLLHMSKIYYSCATMPPGYRRIPLINNIQKKGPLLWECYENMCTYTRALIGEARHKMPTISCAQILMQIGKRSMATQEYSKALFCFLNALCIRSHYSNDVLNTDIIESYFLIGYVYLQMKDYTKSFQVLNRIQQLHTCNSNVKSKYYILIPLQILIIELSCTNISIHNDDSLDSILKNVRDRLESHGLSQDIPHMLNIVWKRCSQDITEDDGFWYKHMIRCQDCKDCVKMTYDNNKCNISMRFITDDDFNECG